MTDESEKILGIERKCSCQNSRVKIIAVGQKSVVRCVNCGAGTIPCESEEHAIFRWNKGFTF